MCKAPNRGQNYGFDPSLRKFDIKSLLARCIASLFFNNLDETSWNILREFQDPKEDLSMRLATFKSQQGLIPISLSWAPPQLPKVKMQFVILHHVSSCIRLFDFKISVRGCEVVQRNRCINHKPMGVSFLQMSFTLVIMVWGELKVELTIG